jgi:hypothetical protein
MEAQKIANGLNNSDQKNSVGGITILDFKLNTRAIAKQN